MITFNHEKFVIEAVESVLAQITDFDYEIVIRDDCSIDNTPVILAGFAERFPGKVRLLPSSENLGMIRNFKTVLKACKGDYIAFCEGDDFWIDPFKIEEQVKLLEKDPELGFVYTNYNIVDEENKVKKEVQYISSSMPEGHILSDIVKGGFPYTLTVCARRSAFIDDLDNIIKDDYRMGDYPLWLHIAKTWKVAYLPKVTASYRRHANSVTANAVSVGSKLKFNDSWIDILSDFLSRGKITDPDILQIAKKEKYYRLIQNYLISSGNGMEAEYNNYWNRLLEYNILLPHKVKLINLIQRIPFYGSRIVKSYYSYRNRNTY